MLRLLLLCLGLTALAACGGQAAPPLSALDCRTGIYRALDGDTLVLTPTSSGGYRWRRPDGRTGALAPNGEGWRSTLGWTGEPDDVAVDLADCDAGEIRMGAPDALISYRLAPLQLVDTTFERDGVRFAGRLVAPPGEADMPLVVFVHGSGSYSAIQLESFPYMLAAQGVAVFVYDKRGTGASGGRYTQDFHVLAADARAALAEAKRLAGDRASRFGFMGASQGGWVAPLAASEAEVDFVLSLYGLAESALAEDRNQVIQSIARAGWGEAEQAKAAAIADAAGVIMASNFRDGFEEFDRLRRAHRNEPWFADIDGEFTEEMLPHPEIGLRLIGPWRDRGTSWEYDPMPVLRSLEAPQFWMIAADDTEAPPEETIRRIRQLQREGRPIDLAIYPGADHGMILTERNGDEVRETGYVSDYYRQLAAWITNRDLTLARAAGAEVAPAQ